MIKANEIVTNISERQWDWMNLWDTMEKVLQQKDLQGKFECYTSNL